MNNPETVYSSKTGPKGIRMEYQLQGNEERRRVRDRRKTRKDWCHKNQRDKRIARKGRSIVKRAKNPDLL